jgi:hypothetical protein
MGQKQSLKIEKNENEKDLKKVDERKIKSRFMTLDILERCNEFFVNKNWIQKIIRIHVGECCINKYFGHHKASALMDKIFCEFQKSFDRKSVEVSFFTPLFKQRALLLKETEQIIIEVDKKDVDSNDTSYEESFQSFIKYLLLLMQIPSPTTVVIHPTSSELQNYIIQIYICINILERHLSIGDTKLLFDKYNSGTFAGCQNNYNYHNRLFASNLTTNFLDNCFAIAQKKIPREILSIIIEYDQLVGERLLEPSVENLIYSRVTFPNG